MLYLLQMHWLQCAPWLSSLHAERNVWCDPHSSTAHQQLSTSAERSLTCRLCFLPLQGEWGYSIPTYITAVYCVLTGHVQRFCQHSVSYSVGVGKRSHGSQCIQLMYYCWHAESLTNCVTHVSCSEIPLVHWTPWTAMSPYNITTSTWLTQCL